MKRLTSTELSRRVVQLRRFRIPKRYEDQPMMDESGKCREERGFLPAAEGARPYEHADVFSVQGAGLPEAACCVPECLVERKEVWWKGRTVRLEFDSD